MKEISGDPDPATSLSLSLSVGVESKEKFVFIMFMAFPVHQKTEMCGASGHPIEPGWGRSGSEPRSAPRSSPGPLRVRAGAVRVRAWGPPRSEPGAAPTPRLGCSGSEPGSLRVRAGVLSGCGPRSGSEPRVAPTPNRCRSESEPRSTYLSHLALVLGVPARRDP